MILLRSIILNLGDLVWTVIVGILGLAALPFGRRAAVFVSDVWTGGIMGWLELMVGLRYEVRGRENMPAGPAIYAVKHQSAWDTLFVHRLLHDPAIVYKRELVWLPFVGLYILATQMIPIDRKGGAATLRTMVARGKRAIGQGRSIVIFPEGTRGRVGQRLPYLPGVGALYVQLGVPLVPVAHNAGHYWGKAAFIKKPGKIIVEILPPIEPGTDRRRAMALLEERIEAAVVLIG